MSDWLANLGGGQYVSALLWTLAALVLLAVVLTFVKRSRGARSGTFISGGRTRAPRLAVVDATAVDSQRRLVLVRRDDVEHLILIGGPTDIVIEPAIGRPAQRPVATPAQPPARPTRPAEPVPQSAARPTGTVRAQAAEPRAAEPTTAAAGHATSHAGNRANADTVADMRPDDSPLDNAHQAEPAPRASWQPEPEARPERHQPAREEPEHRPQPVPAQNAPLSVERETALLEEIDLSIDEMDYRPVRQEPPQQPGEMSIEDEMSRLLDDLADDRKKDG
ncbi:flagellar biosynthetic protein FliO [Nitratireductor luteus]|uniref:flagellar biosynthetic protein FliO n=1 Tax=Nitratireductor luteus TaxID=2976980 RepID=UPI002240200F|nr:flagellar biosynthetic protein FliO [Nitratireductor luteus]